MYFLFFTSYLVMNIRITSETNEKFSIPRVQVESQFRLECGCGGRARNHNCRALRVLPPLLFKNNRRKRERVNPHSWNLSSGYFEHRSQFAKMNTKVLEKFWTRLLPAKICKQDWIIYVLWIRTKIHFNNTSSWFITSWTLYIINSIFCFK